MKLLVDEIETAPRLYTVFCSFTTQIQPTNESLTNTGATKSNGSTKPLLNREKQKLLALSESQTEEPASENQSSNTESDETEYVKFPNLNPKSKQKRDVSSASTDHSQEINVPQTSKNVIVSSNTSQTVPQQHISRTQTMSKQQSQSGQNYVLAQMTKYQRNNSFNLLNLSTNKLLVNSGSCHNNNFMSSGVIRPKNSLLKQKDMIIQNGDVDIPTKHQFANQILCRGNTLITRELSQHVLNQQQKIKTLDTQTAMQQQGPQGSLNASKAKLSQIQSKPRSSNALLQNISNQNKHTDQAQNSNTNNDIPPHSNTTQRLDLARRKSEQDQLKHPMPELHSILKTSESKLKVEPSSKPVEKVKVKVLEEPALSKPQGLYTYAVTSSCQLRESFYNNRSLINTSTNCTNQLIYNRSDSFYGAPGSDEAATAETESIPTKSGDQSTTVDQPPPLTANSLLPSQIEEIRNTKKNRRLFKDLDFIYNEQQVFKLSRQIWFQIRTNKYRTNQNRLNENHLNQYLDQLNNSSMLINKLYNYDVYKFYERAKISLLIKCLTPLKSNFAKNSQTTSDNTAATNHIIKNINNIATIAEKNAAAGNLEFNKNIYSFDKDLIIYKNNNNQANESQTSMDAAGQTIEEEEDEIDENENEDGHEDVINRDLFYAELEKQQNEQFPDDETGSTNDDSSSQKDGKSSPSSEASTNQKRVVA